MLALHACGNATDAALLQAHRHRAAFIVSPCCVGKLKFSTGLAAGGAPSGVCEACGAPDSEPAARCPDAAAAPAAAPAGEGANTHG